MSVKSKRYINITNSGYIDTIPMASYADITRVTLPPSLVLTGDVELGNTSELPPDGLEIFFIIVAGGSVDLNGYHFHINGVVIEQDQLQAGLLFYNTGNGTDWDMPVIIPSWDSSAINQSINGKYFIDDSIDWSKMFEVTRGHIIRGNSSNRPEEYDCKSSGYILIGDGTDLISVAQSGDVTFNTSGVSAIASGVIVNADVNSSAAISRSKMASGTASHVIINDGSGAFSSEAQLAVSRGGTGINTSASTGFPVVSTGTWSVGSIAVDRDLDVSFEAGEVGDFKIYMGFAGTLTNIYAYATKVIAGTDNATIVPKNNSGTTMGTGTITFTASDARGTAYTATPSTNNTFVAGDILTFTCAKTTAGGKAHLSLKFTRTA